MSVFSMTYCTFLVYKISDLRTSNFRSTKAILYCTGEYFVYFQAI